MKFLKYLLIFILVVTLLVVLTIISWWKDWPIFSGAIIVGGILFTILLAFGAKKLWQLKNKQKFINAIFNHQAKINEENAKNSDKLPFAASEIKTIWKQGIKHIQKFDKRFNKHLETNQSWYLVLDDRHLNNAKNIGIFDFLGSNIFKNKNNNDDTDNNNNNNNNNNKKTPLLSWHFLNSSILLHTGLLDTDSDSDNTAWNELLTLISSQGKNNLKGVIFSIDIQILQDLQDLQNIPEENANKHNDKQNLTKLSQAMRERLNTLMLAINKNIPVYYVCNGLENIEGFTDWLNRLPNDVLNEIYLGMLNNNVNNKNFHENSSKFFGVKDKNNDINNVNTENSTNNTNLFTANNLIHNLQNFIRKVIDKNALEGMYPRGDDLMLIIKLEKIIKNLFLLFDFTFAENKNLISPNLRGSFFCACEQNYNKNGKVAFLNAFVNNLLNKEPDLREDLNTKNSFKATTKTICYASFLGILFTFCGLVTVHTLYQNKILNKLQTYQQNFSDGKNDQKYANVDQTYYKLDKDLHEILFLENANKNWWLPKFGVSILDKIIEIKREKFIVQSFDYVINPILELNRNFKYTNSDNNDTNLNIDPVEQEEIDKVVVIDWFSTKINNIQNGSLTLNSYLADDSVGTIEPFPVTNAIEKVWTPLTDDIIVATLFWTNNEDKLRNYSILDNIKKDLSTQFYSIAYKSAAKDKFHIMQPILSAFSQRLNVSDTCLSDFWMHIVPKSQNDFCIPSIYTAKVANFLEETKNELFSVVNNDTDKKNEDLISSSYGVNVNKEVFMQDNNKFLNIYYANYAAAWDNFVLRFSDTLKEVNNKDIFIRHTNVKNVDEIPYLKLLRVMVRETYVLKNMNRPPNWLIGIERLDILITILSNIDININSGNLSVLLNIAYTVPNALKNLRSVSSGNEDMFELIKSLPNLKRFFYDINRLSKSLQSSEQALKIVTAFYSGSENNISNTENNQNNANNNHIGNIYKDAGDFVATISSKYEDKNAPQLIILRDIINMLSTGLVIQAGNEIQRLWEKEVLNTAIYRLHKDNAEALFGDNGIVQMFAEKHLRPFITWQDGSPIANTWEGQVFPLTDDFLSILRSGEQAVLNKPQDKYKISIYTQPTIVNFGAKVLPNATRIVLDCNDNQQEIINKNYPIARTIDFEPKKCSSVNISIIFPQFELQHKFNSFGEFIAAFQEGEITLYSYDFTQQNALLKEANINEIKLRILPDNTQNFLADQDIVVPTLPDRITYTW